MRHFLVEAPLHISSLQEQTEVRLEYVLLCSLLRPGRYRAEGGGQVNSASRAHRGYRVSRLYPSLFGRSVREMLRQRKLCGKNSVQVGGGIRWYEGRLLAESSKAPAASHLSCLNSSDKSRINVWS